MNKEKHPKIIDAVVGYLAFISLMAGLIVCVYTNMVMSNMIFINVQSLIHHGSQVILGVYIFVWNRKSITIKTTYRSLLAFLLTMIIAIFSEFGNCGKKGILLEAEFNNAEYSMKIDYNSNSTNINLTTLTNFEKYKYNIKSYQIIDSDETKCCTVAYIQLCIFPLKCQINSIINTENFINDKKDFEESIIIEN